MRCQGPPRCGQDRLLQVCFGQIGGIQPHARQIGVVKLGFLQIRAVFASCVHIRNVGQLSQPATEIGVAQVSRAELRATQLRGREVDPAQIGSDQHRTLEVAKAQGQLRPRCGTARVGVQAREHQHVGPKTRRASARRIDSAFEQGVVRPGQRVLVARGAVKRRVEPFAREGGEQERENEKGGSARAGQQQLGPAHHPPRARDRVAMCYSGP